MSELVMMPQKDYKDICDAVRAKTGGTELLKSGDLKAQIESIQSGGGSSASVPWNDVTFIDYDGTVLYSYTLEEAQALTELPPLPEQKGLICQGWNWSLEDIKAQNGAVTVGAMYTTDDGKTRIYIHLTEGRTSPMLGVCPNGTVTVDWGDGTEPDVLTGTSTSTVKWTPTHNYAEPGDYVISLSVDGSMMFRGSSTYLRYSYILTNSSSADPINNTYYRAIKKVEFGNGVTAIGPYAFNFCGAIETITIHNGVTGIEANVFSNCYALKSITIPNGVSVFYSYTFDKCYNLESISIPSSLKSIGNYTFRECSTLAHIYINNGVTYVGGGTFQNDYLLSYVFVPNSLMSIESSAFSSCYGVRYFDFSTHTSVPTLAATIAFDGIPADCQMLIPSALYDEWSTATNWATYASKMVAV